MYYVTVSFCDILVGVPQDFVNVKNVPRLKKGWKSLHYITHRRKTYVMMADIRPSGVLKLRWCNPEAAQELLGQTAARSLPSTVNITHVRSKWPQTTSGAHLSRSLFTQIFKANNLTVVIRAQSHRTHTQDVFHEQSSCTTGPTCGSSSDTLGPLMSL